MFRRLRKHIYDFGEKEDYEGYRRFAEKLCQLYVSAKFDKKKIGASKKLRAGYEKKAWNLLESI